MTMYEVYMLTTYMCAPGCRRGKAAEGRTGGPGCTWEWGCAGRCSPLPQGWTYSPKGHTSEKHCDNNINRHSKEQTFICLQYASRELFDLVCRFACQGWPGLTWPGSQFSSAKQQEGQVMTEQTTAAWLTHYLLYTSVNEFSVRAFVSFAAYVDRCLPAVQMASMLMPSSTCCSLVTLPLLWLSPASVTPFLSGYKTNPFSLSLVGQSWQIPLKCLVHTGDTVVCLHYESQSIS